MEKYKYKPRHVKKIKTLGQHSCDRCVFNTGFDCGLPADYGLISKLDKKHGDCRTKGHIYQKKEPIRIHWLYWAIMTLILLFIFMCSCQKEDLSCFRFKQQQSHTFIFNEDTIHTQCCYPKIFEVCSISTRQADSIIQARTFTRDTTYNEEVWIESKSYPFIDVEILQICSYY